MNEKDESLVVPLESPALSIDWSGDAQLVCADRTGRANLLSDDMEAIGRLQVCDFDLDIVKWSPNAKWLGCFGEEVWIVDGATHQVVIRTPCAQMDTLLGLAWKASSEAFAHVHGQKILALSYPDGKMVASWEMSCRTSSLEWVGDTHYLLAGTEDGSVWKLDSQNPDSATLFGGRQVHNSDVRALAINPRGDILATAGNDGRVGIWDLASEQQLGLVSELELKLQRDETSIPVPAVRDVAWSPNGDRLAIGTTKAAVFLWSPVDQQIVAELQGHSKSVNSVAFHPKKPILTTAAMDSTLRLWDV
jgi:hypothetical protein